MAWPALDAMVAASPFEVSSGSVDDDEAGSGDDESTQWSSKALAEQLDAEELPDAAAHRSE
eukprot:4965507-Alexandrium_andersonii.AAC.1